MIRARYYLTILMFGVKAWTLNWSFIKYWKLLKCYFLQNARSSLDRSRYEHVCTKQNRPKQSNPFNNQKKENHTSWKITITNFFNLFWSSRLIEIAAQNNNRFQAKKYMWYTKIQLFILIITTKNKTKCNGITNI